ncbi:MAG: ferrous iron transport protein A [Dehalococcoidales bacterium]|nr:ferrous iron transport protein A [Dehalococcoidales bacterium]
MMEYGIPLSLAGNGTKLTVTAIAAGCGLQRRLADMGLTPGVDVMVVGGCHPGPLLIDIRGSRLGLGFGVAQKIMVKEREDYEKADCGRTGRQSQLR